MRVTPPLPASDWTCVRVRDAQAGDNVHVGRCAFCKTRIRWVHVLAHDDHPGEVGAGCCCAARLCFGYDADGAERELKNRAERLARFADPRGWRASRANPDNLVRQVRVGNHNWLVTIYSRPRGYGYFIAGPGADERHRRWPQFDSRAAAMRAAFESVEDLRCETPSDA